MKFKVKADYPQTYFVGGQALRLGPDDEYETDDPALIEELKAHDGFSGSRGARRRKVARRPRTTGNSGVSVVIPTIVGREESLARVLDSFAWATERIVIHDMPTCGAAWVEGAREARGGGYICFAADDLEARPSFIRPMAEAVREGKHPAARVELENGALQSCGGRGWDVCGLDCEDWREVDWSPTPFIKADWWEILEPHADALSNLHYASDVLVSELLKREGIGSVHRREALMVHGNHPVGRGAGASQPHRAEADGQLCRDYLAATA